MHDHDEPPGGHAAVSSLSRPSSPDAAADPLLAALDQLVCVGRNSVVGWIGVMTLTDQIREQRARGISNVNRSPDACEALISTVALLQSELTTAAAQFRRAAAQQLRSEGMTAANIARTFGVTRQRVAHLLTP